MEAASQPAGRARVLHALRSRDFRLLWGGQTVSLIGNAAFFVAIGSRAHGKTKPDPTIFRAVLELLGAEPSEAAMVGDSLQDDVEGARALGMRAFLLDRENRHPEVADRLVDLRSLPAALGLD